MINSKSFSFRDELKALANAFGKEAEQLFDRNIEDPEIGRKYHWILRANLLKDIVRSINGALKEE